MEGSPSPSASDEDEGKDEDEDENEDKDKAGEEDEAEDEDPDADGEPDTEDHFSTHDLVSSSQHEHRSWTPEPESQNQTLIAEHGHKSSYELDSSAVEAGEQDGDVQMCEGKEGVEEDELGHAALIDLGMASATEMDGVNETGLNGLGFGDEGILAEEVGLGGYNVVW